jgi:hypothetical protein
MCLCKYVSIHFLEYNDPSFHSSELVFHVVWWMEYLMLIMRAVYPVRMLASTYHIIFSTSKFQFLI